MAKRVAIFIATIALGASFCGGVLPRLSRFSCFDVIRRNLRNDVEATAYFYTEIDDFNKYERAARKTLNKGE